MGFATLEQVCTPLLYRNIPICLDINKTGMNYEAFHRLTVANSFRSLEFCYT